MLPGYASALGVQGSVLSEEVKVEASKGTNTTYQTIGTLSSWKPLYSSTTTRQSIMKTPTHILNRTGRGP